MRTKKIFVGGSPTTLTEDRFCQYFETYGNVTDVVVMYNQQTQCSCGFGFISFDTKVAVDHVLQRNIYDLGGKQVEVKHALPKDSSSGGGSAGGGGRGYQGFSGNTTSYTNPQSTSDGGFPSYGSSGYGNPNTNPGYGYGQVNTNMSYIGSNTGYGGPNYSSGPRGSWPIGGPTGYGTMSYSTT